MGQTNEAQARGMFVEFYFGSILRLYKVICDSFTTPFLPEYWTRMNFLDKVTGPLRFLKR